MPIETNLLALSITDLAILGGLTVLCCALGWQLRRIATRGEEAKLRRSLLDAKGAVPQLESAVRHREQRANTLELEVKGLKGRLSDLETAVRQKETEVVKRDREIRTLNSELTILKQGSSGGEVLPDGDDTSSPAAADPATAKRHATLESRYEAMKRGLIQRDDRIAELEEKLRNPASAVPTRTLEDQLSELEQASSSLQSSLAEREAQLEAVQARLQEEVAERQALEDLAKRRSETNREIKAAAAHYEQQLPALMKTVEARDAQIAERDSAIANAGKRLVEADGRIEAHERTVATLQHAIKDRDFKIEGLETTTSQQSAKLEMLRGAFFEAKTEHKGKVASLEQQLAERDAAIAAQETEARARESLAVAEAQHTSSSERVAEMESRLATAEARNRSLEDILSARELAIADLELAADELRHEVANLAHSLAGSRSTLAQRQSAIMWLVAQLGAPALLLPPPAVAPGSANGASAAGPSDCALAPRPLAALGSSALASR